MAEETERNHMRVMHANSGELWRVVARVGSSSGQYGNACAAGFRMQLLLGTWSYLYQAVQWTSLALEPSNEISWHKPQGLQRKAPVRPCILPTRRIQKSFAARAAHKFSFLPETALSSAHLVYFGKVDIDILSPNSRVFPGRTSLPWKLA